jgi:hypothetical protein
MQQWAVFTGDIIRSSDLEPEALARIFATLEDHCKLIGAWPQSTAALQRFRGDGWQMALPVRYALRAALVMRAAVRATGKGHDTRIGIGIGAGTLADGDLAAADGPAFVNSGHALDEIKRGPRMAAPEGPDLLRMVLPLADCVVQGWTPKQAQVAASLLTPDPPSHDALAAALGHTRQLIQKQATAAGIAALLESTATFERIQSDKKAT